MDVKAWQVLAGLSALLALYWVSIVVLNVPTSILGFLTMVVFVGIGVAIGRVISGRLS